MYTEAREQARLTQREAAERLHIGIRTLRAYELGDVIPNPEIVLGMSRVYRKPELTMLYCRRECAIGRTYSYEVLDAVNTDLAHVILKLAEESVEVLKLALGHMVDTAEFVDAHNRKCRERGYVKEKDRAKAAM